LAGAQLALQLLYFCGAVAQRVPQGAHRLRRLGVGPGAFVPLFLERSPAQIVAMSAALIAGSIPFGALGLMVGTLVNGSAAPGYANLLYLPGCYLSGMFFPLPKSMYWQAPIWPQFHIDQLAMHAADVAKYQFEPAVIAVATLLGYTVLFSAVAIWRLARKG
jgi:ABC-2 type transport system permease protein